VQNANRRAISLHQLPRQSYVLQSIFQPSGAKTRDSGQKRMSRCLSSAKTQKRHTGKKGSPGSPTSKSAAGGTVSAMLLQNLKMAF
jgi:hypothetical protein